MSSPTPTPPRPSATAALPSGFRFAGTGCGIKASGKPDMALVVGDGPLVGAGVYTTNQIVAAPVVLCRGRTPSSSLRAVVINSGNANACTGDVGMRDAEEMTERVAQRIGCSPEQVLVMSTGVIGRRLPMDRVRAGIDDAYDQLADSPAAFVACSTAIMTTDAFRKSVTDELNLDGQVYRVAAMAKGAGMIAPNMATMLALVTTDAPLAQSDLDELLRHVADHSFNRVSVDGHTSTNDTLVLLSSGSGTPLSGESLDRFRDFLRESCIELAKQLVADGEGATHVMEIRVRGAASEDDANRIAQVVGESPLVKTAITGGDPNWGRIVSAAGYAGRPIDPDRTSLDLLGIPLYRDGTPLAFDAAEASRRIRESPTVVIDLVVGDGPGSATRWASDITVEYVRFNSEYTT
ncbi:MAG: bifunctional glutamate N-acetyltransferase/amino-acid acetyltransferase ArgJ [Planctomycetaceae bacterium]|nr:MAG: bifunctional glutamate N-acetyltransferase/amino-acid acetyltransferase ArgJ [Planctomycetaceae bacterium]